jgi:hypothetical protein
MNFDLENARRKLTALRDAHGADTPMGHRCSNLIEMIQNMPPEPKDRIEYLEHPAVGSQRANLIASIEKTMAEMAAITKAAQ